VRLFYAHGGSDLTFTSEQNVKNTIYLLALSTLTIFIAGCSLTNTHAAPSKPVTTDSTSASLAEAAASVSHSLVNLAKTEQAAEHPVNTRPLPNPDAYGMGMVTSTDWSGPIGPFVQQIADMSGYKIKILGRPPAIPVIVTITARNEKLGSILSNAAFQCGKKANIVVYPGSQTIELRYMEDQA
jgi:defect-in-organelle-trafficking protein DotD